MGAARQVGNVARQVGDFVAGAARQVRDVAVGAARTSENVARQSVNVAAGVARYNAGLSPSANPASPVQLPTTDPRLLEDARYNGTVHRVKAPGGINPGPPVIVVNGINTTLGNTALEGARGFAREMSQMTGRSVELVYNNSDAAVGAGVSLGHETRRARARAEADYNALPPQMRSYIETVPGGRESYILGRTTRYLAEATTDPRTADWAKRNALQNPPAAQTQANMILSQLANYPNDLVRVIGYSQGAAISAQALRMVEQELVRRHGPATANQMLARVQVLTLGGAANANDFPAAVNVTSIAHQGDVVSQYFGANREAFGRGNAGDFVNFVKDGFGLPQHLNYFPVDGNPGNPEVARWVQDWMRNPAAVDRNVILPDYRG